MESATTPHPRPWNSTRLRDRLRVVPLPRPELAALLTLAAVLYLWSLGKNGFANDYYSAAVRSMAGSWHDFLYGSFDAKGLMTVDKPPLALWVEALSVKFFGFDSLAILVPQALMGVASVGLLYDLVRRHWGRIAGTTAGLVLALTPIAVAVSRHNNPDALLVLCSVGALWCFVRVLEHGATRWLVAAGVCVGLGFEAKMGAALMVVPGMALAWLWVAPRGRLAAVRQLAYAGAALVAVALAWPVLVWLTPASSRPWVSGTTDNSIWSLIWEYNGFGRLEGQTGGPGSFGGGGGPFGGETGVFRLLNEALGGQAGWLLGTALVGGIGIVALSRLRRTDPRTSWTIAVGGAFAVTATAFSFAGGIFHPYYTSLLAPFAAALVGATVGQVLAGERGGSRSAVAGAIGSERGVRLGAGRSRPGDIGARASTTRAFGALALGVGAIVELVVISNSASDLGWLVVPLILVSGAAAAALLLADQLAARIGSPTASPAHVRTAALALGVAILLLGPAIWSVETLGHPTSGTFPAGGPESASTMGGPGGGGGFGPGGFGKTESSESESGELPGSGGSPERGAMPEFDEGSTSEAAPVTGGEIERGAMPEFGAGSEGGALPGTTEGLEGRATPGTGEGFEGAAVPGGGEIPGAGSTLGGEVPGAGVAPGFPGPESEGGESTEGLGGSTGGGPGGMFGGEDLSAVVEYTEAHGGGTIAVDSQSEAAASIIEAGAEVAGIGGFSGKESSVSAEWLEERIESGEIAWIYTGGSGGMGGGPSFSGGSRTQFGSALEDESSGRSPFGSSGELGPGAELESGSAGSSEGFGPRGESGSTSNGPGGGFGGDTRTGSESAIETVVEECTAVDSSAYESPSGSEMSGESAAATEGGSGTLYKCGES